MPSIVSPPILQDPECSGSPVLSEANVTPLLQSPDPRSLHRVVPPPCGAFLILVCTACVFALIGCKAQKPHVTIGSKFFTEQVVLAELIAQHIEARMGVPVVRKTNLGGTLLCHKALLAGQLDLYVEYTGTALTGVLSESPSQDSSAQIYQRVKSDYARRFALEVTEPLGFENTFAMVVRGADARRFHLRTISDTVPLAPNWRAGFGYEFLERPDGYEGWSRLYGLHFAKPPSVMDLGLIYRALVERKVDIVAGNSTDGLIAALDLVPLADDKHYFPPYDAVPIVREDTLARFPGLRAVLAELGGKISADEMRRMNAAVDADQRDPAIAARQFREAHGL
jgi:osmoprotectant transport system substrate-binding protein